MSPGTAPAPLCTAPRGGKDRLPCPPITCGAAEPVTKDEPHRPITPPRRAAGGRSGHSNRRGCIRAANSRGLWLASERGAPVVTGPRPHCGTATFSSRLLAHVVPPRRSLASSPRGKLLVSRAKPSVSAKLSARVQVPGTWSLASALYAYPADHSISRRLAPPALRRR